MEMSRVCGMVAALVGATLAAGAAPSAKNYARPPEMLSKNVPTLQMMALPCDVSVHASTVDREGRIIMAGEHALHEIIGEGYYADGEILPSHALVMAATPEGETLWATLLGGDAYDGALAVAVDSENNIIVTGTTRSADWVKGGSNTVYGGAAR